MGIREHPQVFGLPDEQFAPRRPGSGVITKREVRAVALAQLALREDSVVWDIGAGTGAIAIEAGRLARAGCVYAIERDAGALAALEENCGRLAARNVTIVPGKAPAALEGLPDPDAIFVGGSGGALEAILVTALGRLRPDGRLVANLASYEHLALASQVVRRAGWEVECVLVNVARSRGILDVTRFAALNPVFVLTALPPVNGAREGAR